jgi:hypothetical protein
MDKTQANMTHDALDADILLDLEREFRRAPTLSKPLLSRSIQEITRLRRQIETMLAAARDPHPANGMPDYPERDRTFD